MKHLRIFDASDPAQEAKMEELLDNSEYTMVVYDGSTVYLKNDSLVKVYYTKINEETSQREEFVTTASLDEPIKDILNRVAELSGNDDYKHYGQIDEAIEVTIDESTGEKEWTTINSYSSSRYDEDSDSYVTNSTIRDYKTYQGGKLVATYVIN